MLGDGELPSYEEPPCQECSPVPDYCSTGQTVLDPCGCCEDRFSFYGAVYCGGDGGYPHLFPSFYRK